MRALLRRHLPIYALYWLAAVIITYPLVTMMNTAFAGFVYSDAYEMAHHIWWFKYALQTGEPLFYQTLMGYPDGIDGITLWTNPLQFFPAWLFAFALPLPVAQNVTVLLYLSLNGLAMYVLALHLLAGRRLPAALAGLVFMAFPTMQGHLGASHLGLLMQWTLPLYALALLKLRDTTQRRWLWIGAGLFIGNAWGHTLQVIYTTLPLTGVIVLLVLLHREWRALRRILIASILGMIGLGLFLIPVSSATLGSAAYTDEGGMVRYSADLLALVTPSFFHPLFGRLDYTHRVLGINLDEGAAYIGSLPLLLSLIAVWKMPKARLWLLLAVIAYTLSLGPLLKVFDQPVALNISNDYETYITLPWAALSSLPLFNLARTPGRFNFALALALAALVGYGAAYLAALKPGSRFGTSLAALAAVFILYEYQVFWNRAGIPELPTAPVEVPAAVEALRDRDDVRAVFTLPWDHLVAAKEAIYLQTIHQQPLIAGQVTRRTPVDPAKLTILETTLDPALLVESGVDVVIIHRQHDTDDALLNRARAQLGEPTYLDERFALFETPASTTRPPFTVIPSSAMQIGSRADSYVYTQNAGWGLLEVALNANGRTAVISLNGVEIQRQVIEGAQRLRVPLPLLPGYHTVRLAVEPPCPQVFSESLRCRSLSVTDFALDSFNPAPVVDPIDFEGGVTLMGRRLPERSPSEGQLPVWLWWRFDSPRSETDIRFVHLLDANQRLVAQQDITLGARQPGEQLVEVVSLAVPADLPPGRYTVFTGWYRFPDARRFPVQSRVAGAESDLVFIGDVIVREP